LEETLSDTYHVFKQNENGRPIFVETVVGLHDLKKRLMTLSSLKPGKYMVYDTTEAKVIEPFKKSA
jgi:hypothetical protein